MKKIELYFPMVCKQNNSKFFDLRFFLFAAGVNDNGIHRGLGKLNHEKKLKSKLSWHCLFKSFRNKTINIKRANTYIRKIEKVGRWVGWMAS
jgi:hypothetical protein